MKRLHLFLILSVALFISSCAPRPHAILPELTDKEIKIAMILPYKQIGRYAHTTSNAVFAYFLAKECPFALKNFQIDDESPEEIERVLSAIRAEGFRYVIAPLTQKGARVITQSEGELNIFFPTINKNDLTTTAQNIYFGAIDHKAQIERLIPFADSPLVIMYDKSPRGEQLLKETQESYLGAGNEKVIAYAIDRETTNLKHLLEKNEEIQSGTFFLNTPVIKSTMIVSQLSFYQVNAANILSTQTNYDPLMLTMTQEEDREKLYIANSISSNSDLLVETNSLLSNDIAYDWINYASAVGADYFFHELTGEERTFQLPMVNNQIIYPVSIVKPSGSRFKVVEEGVLP
ncbi:hypothetical protein [Sulfurimonas sp. HSL3-7]|uniref:hypothetical protein n=1 Tax=Sulfonitrofixus jiaomeiensis TaxID=3131938 RepID=UPI0031F9F1E0